MDRSLISGFLRSADQYPDARALEVNGRSLSFGDLRDDAARISATLSGWTDDHGPPLTAVLAHRSPTAFAGIVAALLRGHGYVPLNPSFPVDRTRLMLLRSGCTDVVVDTEAASQLPALLEGVERRLLVVLPEMSDVTHLRDQFPAHRFIGTRELERSGVPGPPAVDPDAIAYLLFTSGSTGVPKGVMVAQRNVRAFLDFVVDRYAISNTDRLSQTFDMTFDLSVFDMFAAWERGACVCCPSGAELLRPDRFINDAQLSIFFAVPSAGIYMNRVGMLRPNAFPSLRLSLFCGEPLPVELANRWALAAPASILENLYGPTELTIACMYYRWEEETKAEAASGVVPIGWPFPGLEALVVDDAFRPVATGESGELIMTGQQVTLGYLDDLERTGNAYVTPPGQSSIYYRTGDRVRRAPSEGPFLYVGRVDHQIKVRGHRVELGEVEAAIRETASVDAVVAVGWPLSASGASGIEAFMVDLDGDGKELRARLSQRLPEYMIPRRIHVLDALPLNSNGKFDRPALVELLKEGL